MDKKDLYLYSIYFDTFMFQDCQNKKTSTIIVQLLRLIPSLPNAQEFFGSFVFNLWTRFSLTLGDISLSKNDLDSPKKKKKKGSAQLDLKVSNFSSG